MPPPLFIASSNPRCQYIGAWFDSGAWFGKTLSRLRDFAIRSIESREWFVIARRSTENGDFRRMFVYLGIITETWCILSN